LTEPERDSQDFQGESDTPENPVNKPEGSNTRRRPSGPTAFDVTLLKNDFQTLAELQGHLNFEQFVTLFLDIRSRLECPLGWTLELLRKFVNFQGNIRQVAESLGIPAQANKVKCRMRYLARRYGTRSLKSFLNAARVYVYVCRKLRWRMDYHCDRLGAWCDCQFNCKQAARLCGMCAAKTFQRYIARLRARFKFA